MFLSFHKGKGVALSYPLLPAQKPPAAAKSALGIRGRLIVLALFAIVPLVVDQVRTVNAARNEQLAAASRQAVDLARRAADDQTDLLAIARTFLQVVVHSYANIAATGSSCSGYRAGLTSDAPWARAISVAGPDGHIVCSSNPGSVGLDISDRAHFQQAVRTGNFAVSGFLQGRRLKGATIFTSFPQRGSNGAIEAVAIGVMDMSWIARLTRMVAEQSGAVALMIDGNSAVIARYPDQEEWVGKRFPDHPLVRELLTHQEGAVTIDSLDGVRRIFGYVQLPGTEARLAVGLDEREVLRNVDHDMWMSYLKIGIVGLMVFAVIWFGGETFIVRPIRSLVRISERLGNGRLETRASRYRWVAEFAPLASALDTMAEKLAAHEQELRTANNRLKDLAEIDKLTALANRRAFDAKLAAEWGAALQLQRPLALLMIDVDYFKQFNDLYGHVEGDSCLESIARVLASGVRSAADFVARYGGEEFVLLLPGAGVDEAKDVAERLRDAIASQQIPHNASSVGFVTISIGVISLVPSGTLAHTNDTKILVEAADAMLYLAKQGGRNLVIARSQFGLAQAS